jgi:hypothetical protein
LAGAKEFAFGVKAVERDRGRTGGWEKGVAGEKGRLGSAEMLKTEILKTETLKGRMLRWTPGSYQVWRFRGGIHLPQA